MCGIFGYVGKEKNASKKILTGLKSLEYRGYDSWGMALVSQDKVYIDKHVGKITKSTLAEVNATLGLGHTRWATHGGVTVKNAHPHTNKKKNIIVVHNGIIENFQEIKKTLKKKGYIFKTETDTEILPHLLEEILKKQKDKIKAVRQLFQQIKGLNALIFMFPQTKEFISIKNGSPIVFGETNEGFYLASDATALAPYTQKVYFVEDGELLYFNNVEKSLIDEKENKKKMSFTTLPYSAKETTMGKYPNFMMKEVSEQPAILASTTKTQKENIKNAAELIKNAYGTYFVGCGTAYYACLAATYLFSKIGKKHINAQIGSEFTYILDFIKDTSLVVPLSQSGETIDITSSIKKAKEKNAKILAVTNVLGSTLYRLAHQRLLLNAGPEKCVLATKSFTTKIALLHLLAHEVAGSYEKGEQEIQIASKEVKKIINKKQKFKKIASKIKNKKDIFILGRGASYPTALESALKIKEVSYIHAEGFAGGELKHGVIALVEKGTPVIVYNPSDETFEDTLSSAFEVKARGAYVIGVSDQENDIYDEWIEVKNCGDATIIPNVTVAQLLGYYLALEKGFDPDKPRNLAKSVTVK